MTKEEIRHKNDIFIISDVTFDEHNIYAAMDEYAKQEAICFAKFAMQNSWQELNFGGMGRMWVNRNDYREYSDEDFYELYLKSKLNQ